MQDMVEASYLDCKGKEALPGLDEATGPGLPTSKDGCCLRPGCFLELRFGKFGVDRPDIPWCIAHRCVELREAIANGFGIGEVEGCLCLCERAAATAPQ
ncbi:hypothetical protein [Sphingobium chungbukense]|uniref:hypothetical protein n=1 Tax=Sphingobium chungbukense TaxID=56193 RepID=UPI0012EDBC4B|nr:hypothetical protein [Sphingobium chungbukense]